MSEAKARGKRAGGDRRWRLLRRALMVAGIAMALTAVPTRLPVEPPPPPPPPPPAE
ncbi:MAG: energy transducer TonB, partial [Armatimonadetes bacterium]|nr:energy transducer TonB [Armatimonadota bacterium]